MFPVKVESKNDDLFSKHKLEKSFMSTKVDVWQHIQSQVPYQ